MKEDYQLYERQGLGGLRVANGTPEDILKWCLEELKGRLRISSVSRNNDDRNIVFYSKGDSIYTIYRLILDPESDPCPIAPEDCDCPEHSQPQRRITQCTCQYYSHPDVIGRKRLHNLSCPRHNHNNCPNCGCKMGRCGNEGD